ncbi:hypothetical protein KEJ18_02425 [Candidatus Bathyarchaeota archaeon]|nr:hypothetical protein [Candidatus Bathyarchaeota archaeon]
MSIKQYGCLHHVVHMQFDLALPSAMFLIVTASVLLYRKTERTFSTLLGDQKFSIRDAVIMVVVMGLMISTIAFLPGQTIQIGFMAAYSYMLFMFTYMVLKKMYLAIVPPIVFLLSYIYFFSHLAVFNLFVVIFAIIITVYISTFFTWKTVWLFAAILTIMDIIQVYITGFMKQAAIGMIDLKLPVMLIIPRFPPGNLVDLGTGDLFLAGLLAIQTAKKLGQKTGILVAAMNGVAMFIFEVISFNTRFADFFPATVVVVAGWLASLATFHLMNPKRKKQGIEIVVVEDYLKYQA